ncbi:hypothetical protein HUO13_04810 [Saccharopolyspora erythraea]|uniref:hypothetical protein n=1 Tax=Saccharopolyspora erythraea TaxID=1836 RepID=UPI001BA4E961|nr:hypothetical protein [Saccharopolyspora erythraea]QUH00219.1 hypothetical protein HUO13_04810 [Saccharopolyspora erythraea]
METPHPRAHVHAAAALAASAATLSAFLASRVLSRGEILFAIPVWVTPLAAALGMTAAAAMMFRHHRATTVLTAIALGTMLLTAGGVFFDIATPISYLLVGEPVPDWPMAVTRALALVAAILLFRALVRYRRRALAQCLGCGRNPTAPPVEQRLWLGYAGFLFGLPYPLLKTHWALGGTIGLDHSDLARDGFTRGWLVVPAALVGLVLSLALVHRWGRVWPRWVPGLAGKATPRGLLLFGGWFGSGLLLTMGLPAAVQMLGVAGAPAPRPIEGMHAWPSMVFYGSWLLWGLLLTPATRSYQLRTRGRCGLCGLGPEPA